MHNRLNLLLVAFIVSSVGLGCMGIRKPWRDYSERPFDGAEWRAGDAIERGRMNRTRDMRQKTTGLSKDETLALLGEPDLKKEVEGREVWFYRVDIGVFDAMDLVPISFDEKGRSRYGMVRGSTFSTMAKENEL
jgi:hypothetical protein